MTTSAGLTRGRQRVPALRSGSGRARVIRRDAWDSSDAARRTKRVKAAMTDALGGSTKHLMAFAKAELGRERGDVKRDMDREHRRLGDMFASVSKTLGEVTGKLDAIERDRIVAREQLEAQLVALKSSQGELLATSSLPA